MRAACWLVVAALGCDDSLREKELEVELAKAKMTAKEGRQALREMRDGLDKAHLAEVEAKLTELEDETPTKP